MVDRDKLFREVVRLYETRQYKEGLRVADQILAASPTHGETLAMKGLICNVMGGDRKAEAHELAKLALRHDIRSHVCWHVYGLIHRSDSNYAEAAKCYRNALRIDPAKCVTVLSLSMNPTLARPLTPLPLPAPPQPADPARPRSAARALARPARQRRDAAAAAAKQAERAGQLARLRGRAPAGGQRSGVRSRA